MGLFYLTALYCAIQAFQKNQVRFWAIASVVCCALGMASKEVMVSAPVIILLYDRVFYGDTLRQIFRRRWRLYAGLALTWFILAALLWNRPHQNTIGFSSNIGPWDYAKNQCLMVVTYLRLSIWPHPLILDYGFPIPDLSVTEVAPYAALLLVLISLTIIALRHNPRLGFLGVWVFFILVPTSSFVPILTEVGTERRMYLPLVAPVVFLTILGFEILQRLGSKTNFGVPLPKHRARIAGLFILGIVIVLGCVTVRRNQDYSTKFSIWQTVLDSRPQSPRALNNLGFVLFDESRFEGAIPYFQKALKLKPNFVTAYYNLARALTEAGRPDEALPHYETAFRLDSDASHVQQSMITMLNDLGRAFLVQDQRHKAILHFQKALELQPDYIIARNNLGIAFLRSKRYQEAIDQFQQILKLNPEITGVLNNTTRNNLGVAFLQSKHYQEAIDQFQQILKLNPENTGALDNLDLAIQLQKEGQNPYKRSMR
ncbi:MAG: tetratricopeptide repeat protein [bacterium]|nr:tetratricopeptide repeat protein [bacterium]